MARLARDPNVQNRLRVKDSNAWNGDEVEWNVQDLPVLRQRGY